MIDANLDVDESLARADAGRRRVEDRRVPSPADPRFALPAPVRRHLAALGSLLRVLARPGERVRVCGELDVERVPEVAAAPRVEFVTSDAVSGEGARLRWMDETAARFADRAWATALRLDAPFPSRVVRTVAEVKAFVANEAALWGDHGRWVLKSRYSSAGRDRVLGHPDDERARRHAERLLALRGPCLIEPWVIVEREVGFFVQGDDAPLVHEPLPGLRAIHVPPRRPVPPEGRAGVGPVRRALREARYAGPFGVDAFRYRAPGGAHVWRTVGEVNPRWTLGGLAHAWLTAFRRFEPDRWSAGATLHFEEPADVARAELLLRPDTDGRGAWLSPVAS